MENNSIPNPQENPSMSANMTGQALPQNPPLSQNSTNPASPPVTAGYSGIYKSMNTAPKSSSRRSRGFSFSVGLVLNYIFLIISFVATVLIIVLLIIPQYNKYVENTAKVAETKAELEKVQAHYNYLKGLSDLQSELESNLELSQRAIPLEEHIPQLLNQIAVMAQSSNLDLIRNDFSGVTTNNLRNTEEETDATRAKSVNIQGQLRGTYDNVILFLQTVERAQRLQSVGELRLVEYTEPTTNQEVAPVVEEVEIDATTGIVTFPEFSNQVYEINITLVGYHMKDPQIAELPIEALVAKGATDYSSLLSNIGQMTYYDLDSSLLETEFGRENPFIDPLLIQESIEFGTVDPVIIEEVPEDDGFLDE